MPFRSWLATLVLCLGFACAGNPPADHPAPPGAASAAPSGSPAGIDLLANPAVAALAVQGDARLVRVSTVPVTG